MDCKAKKNTYKKNLNNSTKIYGLKKTLLLKKDLNVSIESECSTGPTKPTVSRTIHRYMLVWRVMVTE